MQLLHFEWAGSQVALPIACVRRVVHAAALAPLPGAPETVLGMLNLHGSMIPVMALFHRSDLNTQSLSPSQHIIIIDTASMRIGVCADSVRDVVDQDMQQATAVPPSIRSIPSIAGVIWLPSGLCIICNPEVILSNEDKEKLSRALQDVSHGCH